MKSEILEAVANGCMKTDIPYFEIGDTVEVHCRIVEGNKTRVQVFTGVVIARKGRGINETFTVRRMISDQGVERIFPLHSPNVVNVVALRSAKVRRAKLYFLRDRTGKAVRLKQRHSTHTTAK
ncbi:MAG: 50S ribosomal protein L19 [Phycisphaerae bacterium]